MAKFEAKWQAEGGYCGGSRPQTARIDESEIDEDMSLAELKELFWGTIKDDFEQTVHYVSQDEEAFVAWSEEIIRKHKQENS